MHDTSFPKFLLKCLYHANRYVLNGDILPRSNGVDERDEVNMWWMWQLSTWSFLGSWPNAGGPPFVRQCSSVAAENVRSRSVSKYEELCTLSCADLVKPLWREKSQLELQFRQGYVTMIQETDKSKVTSRQHRHTDTHRTHWHTRDVASD